MGYEWPIISFLSYFWKQCLVGTFRESSKKIDRSTTFISEESPGLYITKEAELES